jgi:site-specific DNA-methyltransferase (adenine-specific)
VIVHSDPLSTVHHADCLDADAVHEAMAGQRAEALIFDAPFSAKTHAGHSAGKSTADRAAGYFRSCRNQARRPQGSQRDRRDIDYAHFDADQIAAFCGIWLPLCAGWVVSITDDVLAPQWAAAFTRAGLCAFAPLPLVETGSRVRMAGDGPSSWTCWIVVARPRGLPYSKWGALPGAYLQAGEREFNRSIAAQRIVGGKPFRSMCAIVGDYSRKGDLIVDPFAGGGTTLAAAKHMGRRSIGLDRSALHAQLTAKRVAKTREQLTLFAPSSEAPAMRQVELFR